MILDTANGNLDWDTYISTFRLGGRLHIVGAASQVKASVFPLIACEKSIGGSPIGGPAEILMGKARYRIVLQNDFKYLE
jgi:uncharacterized zinc-type alcohol dehydrogenase-like protein